MDSLAQAPRLHQIWDHDKKESDRAAAMVDAEIARKLKRGGNQVAAEAASSAANQDGVQIVRGSELTPEPIRWLWTDWLARGKFHIIAGAPGTGKTTLALQFAATIASGSHWPDGTQLQLKCSEQSGR